MQCNHQSLSRKSRGRTRFKSLCHFIFKWTLTFGKTRIAQIKWKTAPMSSAKGLMGITNVFRFIIIFISCLLFGNCVSVLIRYLHTYLLTCVHATYVHASSRIIYWCLRLMATKQAAFIRASLGSKYRWMTLFVALHHELIRIWIQLKKHL